MKHQLSKFSHVDPKNNQPFEPNIAKDALDGVQQACKIFIHYLTSTANDICTESKRSTLSAVSDYHSLSLSLSLSLSEFLKIFPTARRAFQKQDSRVAESEILTSILRTPSLSDEKNRTTSSARCVKSISTSSSRS